MKVKLNGDQIKQFFVLHTEKIVFGGCIIVLLMLSLGALQKKVYEKGPHELQSLAKQADQELRATAPEHVGEQVAKQLAHVTWDPRQSAFLHLDYSKQAVDSFEVSVNDFTLPPVNPQIAPKFFRRQPPELLTVHDLQAHGMVGAIELSTKGSGSSSSNQDRTTVAGMRCVVLTGFVPLADQQAEFQRALGEPQGKDAKPDVVSYVGFYVERAEVVNGSPGPWTALDLRQAGAAEAKWGKKPAEIVRSDFVHNMLTRPLPPLVGKEWPADVVAHPRVFLAKADVDDPNETRTTVREEQPKEQSPFGFGPPMVNQPEEPTPEANEPQPEEPQDQQADGVLFRFFDMTVEAGKEYTYRVQLWLKNPNYELPPEQLEDPSSAESQYVSTEWSEPSGISDVPEPSRLLAGGLLPGSSARDGEVEIIVQRFSPEQGIWLNKSFRLSRGEVANSGGTTKIGFSNPRNRGEASEQTVDDFKTDIMLLDMAAGKADAGQQQSVSTIFLDGQGHLVIRNQQQDAQAFREAAPATPGVSAGGTPTNTPASTPSSNPLDGPSSSPRPSGGGGLDVLGGGR